MLKFVKILKFVEIQEFIEIVKVTRFIEICQILRFARSFYRWQKMAPRLQATTNPSYVPGLVVTCSCGHTSCAIFYQNFEHS